ncbi:MAG: hypothetical protein AB1586_12600 [Pseudomonadota bacterium]
MLPVARQDIGRTVATPAPRIFDARHPVTTYLRTQHGASKARAPEWRRVPCGWGSDDGGKKLPVTVMPAVVMPPVVMSPMMVMPVMTVPVMPPPMVVTPMHLGGHAEIFRGCPGGRGRGRVCERERLRRSMGRRHGEQCSDREHAENFLHM